jgi:hypothetical protein
MIIGRTMDYRTAHRKDNGFASSIAPIAGFQLGRKAFLSNSMNDVSSELLCPFQCIQKAMMEINAVVSSQFTRNQEI